MSSCSMRQPTFGSRLAKGVPFFCGIRGGWRKPPGAKIIDTPTAEGQRTAELGWLMRLAECYGLTPAPRAGSPGVRA